VGVIGSVGLISTPHPDAVDININAKIINVCFMCYSVVVGWGLV